MSARWYVVQTQPLSEQRADAHLRRQGFTTFLPQMLKRRSHARKIETVSRPLFPRYMFVRIDTATQGWHAIRSTFGVTGLLGGENGPIPVRDGVVESLCAQQDESGHLPAPIACKFARGAAIRVVDGLFASALGFFEGMSDNERISVLLNLLGRQVRIVLDPESVAAA